MRLSDLGGAGNDEFNMRPLAHAFVPKGNRLHTVNAVARGFLRSWCRLDDVAAPDTTKRHTVADGFWRDAVARGAGS